MKQEKLTKFISTENADRKWYVVDAKRSGAWKTCHQRLRALSEVKTNRLLHQMQIQVILLLVINAEKVKVTGKREFLKTYAHYQDTRAD